MLNFYPKYQNLIKEKVLLSATFGLMLFGCSDASRFSFHQVSLNDNDSPEIFNGTKIQEAPRFIYAFRLRSTGHIFCQGSRISKNYLLTAAHCLEEFPFSEISLFQLTQGKRIKSYNVRLLSHTQHPRYKKRAAEIEHAKRRSAQNGTRLRAHHFINTFDLALIKVDPQGLPAFNLNDVNFFKGHGQPVDLLQNSQENEVTIWSLKNHLNEMNFNQANQHALKINLFPGKNFFWSTLFQHPFFLITFERSGHYICPGDSGSGVFLKRNANDRTLLVLGVVVSGTPIGDANGPLCKEFVTVAPIDADASGWLQSTLNQ